MGGSKSPVPGSSLYYFSYTNRLYNSMCNLSDQLLLTDCWTAHYLIKRQLQYIKHRCVDAPFKKAHDIIIIVSELLTAHWLFKVYDGVVKMLYRPLCLNKQTKPKANAWKTRKTSDIWQEREFMKVHIWIFLWKLLYLPNDLKGKKFFNLLEMLPK